ncbi:YihY/virulence factor BrkB family protein [Noviherbaspirillum aerium]|uniref:YihY/virulence factor BrkB family protein n=1 Tax=Noviherbaspirillum aerium TaxID=2588497 RepID=UPI00124D367D|nr:YihY/virulence factor BrkB family protein [Noviherbaspirillum aerium]
MPLFVSHDLTISQMLRSAVRQFAAHDSASYAAAVTYHVLFSTLPFLIVFIALLGFLEISDLFDWMRRRSESFFLQQTIPQINGVLDQLQQRRVGILSFAAGLAVWAASSGMRAMMNALNIVYGVSERRSILKRYVLSIAYTLVVGLMLSIAITLMIVSGQAMQVIAQYIGFERSIAILWAWWLRWPAVILLLTATVAIVYGICPDVEQRFRFVTPGAFLAVIAWIGVSLLLNFYLQHVRLIDEVYGNVGTIIVLLWYVFLSSVVVLFGAEVNAVIEQYAPSGKNLGERKMNERV